MQRTAISLNLSALCTLYGHILEDFRLDSFAFLCSSPGWPFCAHLRCEHSTIPLFRNVLMSAAVFFCCVRPFRTTWREAHRAWVLCVCVCVCGCRLPYLFIFVHLILRGAQHTRKIICSCDLFYMHDSIPFAFQFRWMASHVHHSRWVYLVPNARANVQCVLLVRRGVLLALSWNVAENGAHSRALGIVMFWIWRALLNIKLLISWVGGIVDKDVIMQPNTIHIQLLARSQARVNAKGPQSGGVLAEPMDWRWSFQSRTVYLICVTLPYRTLYMYTWALVLRCRTLCLAPWRNWAKIGQTLRKMFQDYWP